MVGAGVQALTQARYVPDFTAEAMAPCRILKLEKAAYTRAVQQAQLGLVLGGPKNIARQAMRKSEEGGGKDAGGKSRFFNEREQDM